MPNATRALARLLAAIALAAAACDGGVPERGSAPAEPESGPAGAVATGVELRVPGDRGGIGISADALSLRGDGAIVLEGNVRAAFAVAPDAGAPR